MLFYCCLARITNNSVPTLLLYYLIQKKEEKKRALEIIMFGARRKISLRVSMSNDIMFKSYKSIHRIRENEN